MFWQLCFSSRASHLLAKMPKDLPGNLTSPRDNKGVRVLVPTRRGPHLCRIVGAAASSLSIAELVYPTATSLRGPSWCSAPTGPRSHSPGRSPLAHQHPQHRPVPGAPGASPAPWFPQAQNRVINPSAHIQILTRINHIWVSAAWGACISGGGSAK